MYLLGTNKVVLLARDNCSWYMAAEQSKAILLEIRDGKPVLVKELGIPGYVLESRMVGTALYVTANSYQQKTISNAGEGSTGVEWQWGSSVNSYDLSDFANASSRSSDWVGGWECDLCNGSVTCLWRTTVMMPLNI